MQMQKLILFLFVRMYDRNFQNHQVIPLSQLIDVVLSEDRKSHRYVKRSNYYDNIGR